MLGLATVAQTVVSTPNSCIGESLKGSVFSFSEGSKFEVSSGSQVWPALGECVASGNSHSECSNAFVSIMSGISSDCSECGSLFFTGNISASS